MNASIIHGISGCLGLIISMKHTYLIFLLVCLMLPVSATSQWKDRQGRPVDENEWMKSSGEFGAQLLVIGDDVEFFNRWMTPSEEVRLETVSEVGRGGSVIMPIIFSGCLANASGHCDVTADYRVLRPDGTLYSEVHEVEVWRNRPAPQKGMLELGVGYLKLIIEPSDPEGVYRIRVSVVDHVLGATLNLTQHLTVVVSEDPIEHETEELSDPKGLNHWLTYYYLEPRSDRDIEKVMRLFEYGFFDKPSSASPLVSFLAELFRQNDSRIAGWESALYGMTHVASARYVMQALWQANSPNALRVLNDWPGAKMKSIVVEVQRSPQIDLRTIRVDSPEVLDMLWGAFLASGEAVYVDRIIGVLALSTEAKDNGTRINALKLSEAAKWSLTSNAERHDRVYEICKGFLGSENSLIREEVSEILNKARK